ncbi:MAG TPA: phosphomannomutase/phosphoglucomutase [Candidatus Saccharimonadales bacterium]
MDAIYNIFKAYDVRGKVGTELTADVANKIGKAFADWLPGNGPIAVGRDMRLDSGEIADAVIQGLLAQGRSVVDIGQVTSDMIYYAVGSLGLAGGAMITASHNPGEYNGIKLCREKALPVGLESGLDQIRDHVLANTFKPAAKTPGTISKKDIVEGWIDHVLTFVDTAKLTPLRLVVDAGNGMAGAIFPELEPYVPWEITELYFELDGTFPNHQANPLKFETLHDLIEVIKRDKLDGGIAFDGDGDRAFLIDETGVVLTGGTMTAMLADYFLGLYPGSNIIYEIRNSRTVPRLVEKAGGKGIMVKAGHAYMKQAMLKYDAPFGGESSGHFFFRDNWYADSGLIAAVVGIYVATLSGLKLSELRQRYTYFVATPEVNFEVEDKDGAITRLARQYQQFDINMLDGITVTIDENTWFNARPSNTEPVMRLNAEAKSKSELDALVAKVSGIIEGNRPR